MIEADNKNKLSDVLVAFYFVKELLVHILNLAQKIEYSAITDSLTFIRLINLLPSKRFNIIASSQNVDYKLRFETLLADKFPGIMCRSSYKLIVK